MTPASDDLDFDALREALEDGKITEEEREMLITRGIPDLLIEALEDGVLDETEIKALTKLGLPQQLITALQDGILTEAKIAALKAQLVGNMKTWRENQLRAMFDILDGTKD